MSATDVQPDHLRRGPRLLPGDQVADRRHELLNLPDEELRALYAGLKGHTMAQAKRTMLAPLAIVDIIIWTEAGGDV